MEPIQRRIGRRIRIKRESLNHTLIDVEQLANLSEGQLGRIERGKVNFKINTLSSIVEAMNMTYTELFDFENDLEKPKNPHLEKITRLLSDFNDDELDALYQMAVVLHKASDRKPLINKNPVQEKEPD